MFRTQNLTPGKIFFSEQQNLFPQHVSRAAKLGNLCIRNNVSYFSQAFIFLQRFRAVLCKITGGLRNDGNDGNAIKQ